MKKTLVTIMILGCSLLSWSQDLLSEYRAKYPNDPAIFLKRKGVLRLDLIGDSVTASLEHFQEMLILKNVADAYNEKDIYYSSLVKLTDIEANSQVPNGKKYKTIHVKEFSEKDVTERGIFFNDTKAKTVLFPSLCDGAKTYLYYKEEYTEPRLLSAYFLSSYLPTVESELVIIYNKKIKLNNKFINLDMNTLQKSRTEKGDYITETYKATNLSKLYTDDGSPNIRYYAPQIMVLIQEIKGSAKTITYAQSPKDLYNWCFSFVKDINKHAEEKLKEKVDSIVAGSSNEKEKSRKIFYWVQENVRYVAFEDGYGGYIPRNAEDVYAKRYGDCKDMANIIVTMHKLAGLEASLVWIGSRDIPYSVNEVPTGCIFNHMIAAARLDGEVYFLDATGKYEKYGIPTSMIQGKEGLLCINKDSCAVMRVPEVIKEENNFIDTVRIRIENNKVVGNGRKLLTGYPKYSTAHRYSVYSGQEKTDYVHRILTKGNNKCKISDFNVKDTDHKDNPFAIDYAFSIEDYLLKTEKETFINLNLTRDFFDGAIDLSKRELDYEIDYKYQIAEITYFDIPQGYKLGYLPATKNYQGKDFGFTISYEVKNDKVIYTKKIFIDHLMLKKQDFTSWNKMIQELNKAYKENISIIKK